MTANKWDVCIDLGALWSELLRIGRQVCAYVFTATQPFATALINSQPKLFRYDLVWDRCQTGGFLNANRQPLRKHELILHFGKGVYNPQKTPGIPYKSKRGINPLSDNYGSFNNTPNANETGDRHPTSILAIPCKRQGLLHPTQKPVALLEWLIKTYTNEGDTVLDPTMGSGTTGVACRNTGRKFIGIEKELKYYEVAKERIHGAL